MIQIHIVPEFVSIIFNGEFKRGYRTEILNKISSILIIIPNTVSSFKEIEQRDSN